MAQSEPPCPSGIRPQSTSGEVVLIADDDECFRMALRTILTRTLDGAQVLETASLDEAVERLSETGNTSLALFDLAMPGMERAALLGRLRPAAGQTGVPVHRSRTSCALRDRGRSREAQGVHPHDRPYRGRGWRVRDDGAERPSRSQSPWARHRGGAPPHRLDELPEHGSDRVSRVGLMAPAARVQIREPHAKGF